eukprot:TRINITY_DN5556_c1_g1_i1.p1 TRINITY_DN5556_c1_g1~~TRINITY_DN5556_c1_g1_i1.p1  ORF type:complete len:1886 (+),score=587.31 TRINITY_DN5556_c1_g1_i1:234-5891(+)
MPRRIWQVWAALLVVHAVSADVPPGADDAAVAQSETSLTATLDAAAAAPAAPPEGIYQESFPRRLDPVQLHVILALAIATGVVALVFVAAGFRYKLRLPLVILLVVWTGLLAVALAVWAVTLIAMRSSVQSTVEALLATTEAHLQHIFSRELSIGADLVRSTQLLALRGALDPDAAWPENSVHFRRCWEASRIGTMSTIEGIFLGSPSGTFEYLSRVRHDRNLTMGQQLGPQELEARTYKLMQARFAAPKAADPVFDTTARNAAACCEPRNASAVDCGAKECGDCGVFCSMAECNAVGAGTQFRSLYAAFDSKARVFTNFTKHWCLGGTGFNASGRPWFVQTRGIKWTELYEYPGAAKTIGVTVAGGLYGHGGGFLGAFGVDYSFNTLAMYLHASRPSPKTVIAMFDLSGFVLASSLTYEEQLQDLGARTVDGGERTLAKLAHFQVRNATNPDSVLKRAFDTWVGIPARNGGVMPKRATLYNGADVMLAQMLDHQGFQCTLVTFFPQKEVVGEVHDHFFAAFLWAMGMSILASLLVVVFTTVTVQPLRALAVKMEAVADLRPPPSHAKRPAHSEGSKIDPDADDVGAHIKEIRSMQRSFNYMVLQVQEYRRYLPHHMLMRTEEDGEAADPALDESRDLGDISAAYSAASPRSGGGGGGGEEDSGGSSSSPRGAAAQQAGLVDAAVDRRKAARGHRLRKRREGSVSLNPMAPAAQHLPTQQHPSDDSIHGVNPSGAYESDGSTAHLRVLGRRRGNRPSALCANAPSPPLIAHAHSTEELAALHPPLPSPCRPFEAGGGGGAAAAEPSGLGVLANPLPMRSPRQQVPNAGSGGRFPDVPRYESWEGPERGVAVVSGPPLQTSSEFDGVIFSDDGGAGGSAGGHPRDRAKRPQLQPTSPQLAVRRQLSSPPVPFLEAMDYGDHNGHHNHGADGENTDPSLLNLSTALRVQSQGSDRTGGRSPTPDSQDPKDRSRRSTPTNGSASRHEKSPADGCPDPVAVLVVPDAAAAAADPGLGYTEEDIQFVVVDSGDEALPTAPHPSRRPGRAAAAADPPAATQPQLLTADGQGVERESSQGLLPLAYDPDQGSGIRSLLSLMSTNGSGRLSGSENPGGDPVVLRWSRPAAAAHTPPRTPLWHEIEQEGQPEDGGGEWTSGGEAPAGAADPPAPAAPAPPPADAAIPELKIVEGTPRMVVQDPDAKAQAPLPPPSAATGADGDAGAVYDAGSSGGDASPARKPRKATPPPKEKRQKRKNRRRPLAPGPMPRVESNGSFTHSVDSSNESPPATSPVRRPQPDPDAPSAFHDAAALEPPGSQGTSSNGSFDPAAVRPVWRKPPTPGSHMLAHPWALDDTHVPRAARQDDVAPDPALLALPRRGSCPESPVRVMQEQFPVGRGGPARGRRDLPPLPAAPPRNASGETSHSSGPKRPEGEEGGKGDGKADDSPSSPHQLDSDTDPRAGYAAQAAKNRRAGEMGGRLLSTDSYEGGRLGGGVLRYRSQGSLMSDGGSSRPSSLCSAGVDAAPRPQRVKKRVSFRDPFLMQITRRSVTMASVNLSITSPRKWGDPVADSPNSQPTHQSLFVEKHAKCFETIVMCVKAFSGVVDGFHGDKVCASFNAAISCRRHMVSAARCTQHIVYTLTPLPMMSSQSLTSFVGTATSSQPALTTTRGGSSTSIHTNDSWTVAVNGGVSVGKALCGNLGCVGMRRFSVLGDAGPIASVLERWGREWGLAVVVDERVFYNAPQLAFRAINTVRNKDGVMFLVYELLAPGHQPQRAEEGKEVVDSPAPYVSYNKAVAAVCRGQYALAFKYWALEQLTVTADSPPYHAGHVHDLSAWMTRCSEAHPHRAPAPLPLCWPAPHLYPAVHPDAAYSPTAAQVQALKGRRQRRYPVG